jgi:hypothetical protein
MWLALRIVILMLLVFVLPTLAAAGWWLLKEHPASWHQARWDSSGVLPAADADGEAAIYVMAARTGGLKGALAVHTWIATKEKGAESYVRYDKVGWGNPIRRNGYPADARWYSNEPWVVRSVRGAEAQALIPRVQAAIASYPFSHPGDYVVWPGPNSNSFVAHVVEAVPELGARMPSNATGRDFAPGLVDWGWSESGDIRVSLGGYVGVSAGRTRGLEVNFLGLVAGFDLDRPAIKIPAFGTVSLAGGEAVAAE